MYSKNTFYKILLGISSTFLLVIYFFMFFNYKNSVISSATLRFTMVAEALGSNLCPTYTLVDNLNTVDSNTINTFNINSPTNKLILISISDQMTYIFKGSSNNWLIEKEFLCSTGLPGTETPKGVFSCGVRGCWFFSEKFHMGAKYYIHINDCYYLHSVPFYSDENTIAEETLGKPMSHGCVRLSVDDSKWVYDNVPDRSTIIIY